MEKKPLLTPDESAEIERQKRIDAYEAETGEKWTAADQAWPLPHPDEKEEPPSKQPWVFSAPFERAEGERALFAKRLRIAHELHARRRADGECVPAGYPSLAELQKAATRVEAIHRWAECRYGKPPAPVPGLREMVKHFKNDYGYTIQLKVNEKDLGAVRMTRATEKQKKGGRPTHR